MADKPKCRWCGKELSLFKYRRNGPYPFDPETLDKIKATFRVDPEWGYYGDGFFCGKSCGFDWAVRHLKIMER